MTKPRDAATCGYPTKAGGVCRQPGSPCKYHAPDRPMARIGRAAQIEQAAAELFVNLATRRTVGRTLDSISRGLAHQKISDKRANVIVRACAERIRMFDLRLQEREEALTIAERKA